MGLPSVVMVTPTGGTPPPPTSLTCFLGEVSCCWNVLAVFSSTSANIIALLLSRVSISDIFSFNCKIKVKDLE